jgi:alpha-tubulin suppressor-like RCC1 family protein
MNGTVQCWGDNRGGQLGDNTTTERLIPVPVQGLPADIQEVGTGWKLSCARALDGRVFCWGAGDVGQLGNNGTSDSSVPLEVSGLGGSVKATKLAVASQHACAVTSAGTLRCWGENSAGALGDGTTQNRVVPVEVPGLQDVIDASISFSTACALQSTGKVKCWGSNYSGQLGDGTTDNRLTPGEVQGLSDVRQIAVSYGFSCAVTNSDQLLCWGANDASQLGSGTVPAFFPVGVSGVTGVKSVSAGSSQVCAVSGSGAVKCWGRNGVGVVGDSHYDSIIGPTEVAGIPGGAKVVSAGPSATCAITNTNALWCWGYYPQLGANLGDTSLTPVDVVGLSSGVTHLALGYLYSCARTHTGAVKCWGYNANGALGAGHREHRATPVDVLGLASGVKKIAAGNNHSCAITQAGKVKCWGAGDQYEFGSQTSSDQLIPLEISGFSDAIDIDSAIQRTCIATSAGYVGCIGGTSTSSPGYIASTVSFTGVGVGYNHACGVGPGNWLMCWGGNSVGQLGNGTGSFSSGPTLTAMSAPVKHVSGSGWATCVVDTNGAAKCWGQNTQGHLGDGTLNDAFVPKQVAGLSSGMKSIDITDGHACAVKTNGDAYCWGDNEYGQLGIGNFQDQLTPVPLPTLAGSMDSIVVGGQHACGITTAGGVKCWGSGYAGALGNGSLGWTHVPTGVVSR